ncbi:hypothetical protein B566_EDAN005134 [Ephemera danica]|nr:hypothetical protein B566_EDAN005134 [Ephemera danica]
MKLFAISIFYFYLVSTLTWGDNDGNTARTWRKGENATVDEIITDLRSIINLAKIREQENRVAISDLTDENRQLVRNLKEQIAGNEAALQNLRNSFNELQQKWKNSESSVQQNNEKFNIFQTQINSLTDNITNIVTGGQARWSHASSLCHELGMRMVILDTKEKNDKIFNYIKKAKRFPLKHFWIGAIRITKQDGTYEYVWQNTVQAVTESSWDVSQPDGHANEECVEIWGGANRLAWNNIHCSDGNGVICEMIN